LFNPPSAARCDCGYDFAAHTVKSSYLLTHIFAKRGGEAAVVEQASRAQIWLGAFLLVASAISIATSLQAGNHTYLAGGTILVGGLLIRRGVQQRRQGALDRATRDELIRRS
jgi:hypothetical protein